MTPPALYWRTRYSALCERQTGPERRRLIAAAPEPLAALREMERCGSASTRERASDCRGDPAKPREARAALAKADGTDPGLEAHRREKAREAAADLAEERDAITSWRNRG